ncbi:MAG: glycerol-3-phosphate acyltransferase, partial [Chloroflexota bacterium]
LGAYLFGSLPVLQWIARARGYDLSKEHDMHHALWHKVGSVEGFAGVFWDVVKGPIPPVVAWSLGVDTLVIGLSGLAVAAGQMWPILIWFRGKERGNTTGIGAAFGIAPVAMGIAAVPVAIGAFMRLGSSLKKRGKKAGDRLEFADVSNYLPLGMLAGFVVLPLAALALHREAAIVWTLAGLAAMIIVRRLTAEIRKDLRQRRGNPRLSTVLKNRFLYDRREY